MAGRAGRPHGLSGEIYVTPISDDPHRFDAGSSLVTERGEALVVERSRRHHNRLLVKFEGIDDRDAAGGVRGDLYVRSTDLRDLGEDEWWEHQLVGMSVHDGSGRKLGTVAGVVPGAAQDLIAVDTAAGERLVPMVSEIVVSVDDSTGRVVLDPPPGLLD